MITKNQKLKARLIIASTLALVGLGVAPAMAEGSYSAEFRDINPGFTSQNWIDRQNDLNSTRIDMVNCYASNGVPVQSLQLKLWDQHGIFPDATVGPTKSTSGCGVVSWSHGVTSYTLRNSTFYWELESINNSFSNRWMDGRSDVTY